MYTESLSVTTLAFNKWLHHADIISFFLKPLKHNIYLTEKTLHLI